MKPRSIAPVAALLLLLAACAPLPTSPAGSAPGATEAAPSPSVAASPPVEASCEGACSFIERCTGQAERWCRPDCVSELAPRGRSAPYLTCVQALRCDDIRASLMMNEGPLGRCSKSARQP